MPLRLVPGAEVRFWTRRGSRRHLNGGHSQSPFSKDTPNLPARSLSRSGGGGRPRTLAARQRFARVRPAAVFAGRQNLLAERVGVSSLRTSKTTGLPVYVPLKPRSYQRDDNRKRARRPLYNRAPTPKKAPPNHPQTTAETTPEPPPKTLRKKQPPSFSQKNPVCYGREGGGWVGTPNFQKFGKERENQV